MKISRLLIAASALAVMTIPAPAVATTPVHDEQITYQSWESYQDWRGGTHEGTFAIPGIRTGITMLRPQGTTDYLDPHTGVSKTWNYSTWTSPVTNVGFQASELVASWNVCRGSCKTSEERGEKKATIHEVATRTGGSLAECEWSIRPPK